MAAADGSGASAPMYFVYDGWNLVQEGYTPWSPTRFYIQGGRVDEIVQSYNSATGLLAYHYYDASGHCTLLTDGQGTIKEQYYYDAFGLPRFYDAAGTYIGYSQHGNRFLFTGREWLSDLHLYDYRNRLYQPELGRFLQPDPKEFAAGDYNLYRYCHNDPINNSDPTGLYAVGSGLTPEQMKQVDDAQRTAADKLDRGATAIEYGIASGKDSEAFKAVQRDFEGVFHKPITMQDMAKYAKDARNMVTALLDDGRKGYVISGKDQAYFARNGHAQDVMLGRTGGKSILLNTSWAFKPETQLGFSLSWGIAHEAAHNIGIIGDVYRNSPGYKTLTPQQALNNADNYVEFALGR
jgi:RHS repeat-associated protein